MRRFQATRIRLSSLEMNAQAISKERTMAEAIPEKYLDLFEKKAFANLATVMPDGTPQVTPVWVDYDGTHLIVNSARGRQKDKNMQRNSSVALSIMDPENPYRYLEVRGRVAEITEEGAEDHIDKMAKKYIGEDRYPWRRPGEVRVLYKIEPQRTSQMG
jgi:PPOX class probable F420-dependent enzyme